MEKLLGIAVLAIAVGMGLALAVTEYSKGQCRVEAIQRHMSAEDIAKVCR
jgi:hypothetical protein